MESSTLVTTCKFEREDWGGHSRTTITAPLAKGIALSALSVCPLEGCDWNAKYISLCSKKPVMILQCKHNHLYTSTWQFSAVTTCLHWGLWELIFISKYRESDETIVCTMKLRLKATECAMCLACLDEDGKKA